jgi:hypothetical protein
MTTLVDRYVDEASSHVGAGSREEVRREIHGMVDELVEARLAHGEPEDVATTRVLNELGNPRRFARDWSGEQRYLIGPRHYDEYVGLLTAVATRVLPLVAIGAFAVNLLAGDGSVGRLVGEALGRAAWVTVSAGVQIAFWITVVFVLIERGQRGETDAAPDRDGWTVDDLPPVKPARQISVGDALAGLGFTVFVGVMLTLVYRNGITMYLGDERRAALDQTVPFFNPGIPSAVAWLVLGLLVADGILEIGKYVVGSWTRAVTVAQVVLSLAWAGVAMVVLGGWDLVNPGIRDAVDEGVADIFLGPWFEQTVLVSVLVVSAIAIWEAVRGYLRHRPQPDPWSI